MTKKTTKHKAGRMIRGQRGNTLVLMLIMLPVIIGASGFVLDWGRGVWSRTQLQKAADAAALAGAGYLPNTTHAEIQASGRVTANYPCVDEASYTPMGTQYRVELGDTIDVFFMRLFGHSTMDITASATAIVSQTPSGMRGGGFPFGIINPNLNNDPTDDLAPFNYGRPYVIGYGEDNIITGDWANGSGPMPAVQGHSGRGWRGALGLNSDGTMGDSGADDVRDGIINGWPGDLETGDWIPTKTGNMSSLDRAVDTMLGPNPLPWSEFDVTIHSRISRIVYVPIVHLINPHRMDTYTVQDFNNGVQFDNSQVVVDGFAPFFILSTEEQGDVDGDGNPNDPDWITGYFVPGVQITNYLPGGPGSQNFGTFTAPRLID